jgi:hypothetical protein
MKSGLKDVPSLAARPLRECQPLTLLASWASEKNAACYMGGYVLLEGRKSRTGLEKYNAAPRVKVCTTATYAGLVVPGPS